MQHRLDPQHVHMQMQLHLAALEAGRGLIVTSVYMYIFTCIYVYMCMHLAALEAGGGDREVAQRRAQHLEYVYVYAYEREADGKYICI